MASTPYSNGSSETTAQTRLYSGQNASGITAQSGAPKMMDPATLQAHVASTFSQAGAAKPPTITTPSAVTPTSIGSTQSLGYSSLGTGRQARALTPRQPGQMPAHALSPQLVPDELSSMTGSSPFAKLGSGIHNPAQYHQPEAAASLSQQGSRPAAQQNPAANMGQQNGMAAHFASLGYHNLATEAASRQRQPGQSMQVPETPGAGSSMSTAPFSQTAGVNTEEF